MKNSKWLADILSGIKSIKSQEWKGYEERIFFLHPLYRVGVSSLSNPKLATLFGNSTYGRFKNFRKNLRKLSWFTIQAPLPKDSIIFFQEARQRLIVASQDEGRVLKISVLSGQLALLEGEIELLNFLQKTEFKDHSAKVLDHGENWIITSFCSNHDSLLNEINPEAYLLEHMDTLIMGPMKKFYRAYEPRRVRLRSWIEEAKLRMKGHPSESQLRQLISNLEKFPDLKLLQVQLHFDLHAGNILRNGEEINIIDWEVTTPGLAIIDYFDFYRRYLKTDQRENKAFWKFLAEGGAVPEKLGVFHDKFEKWQEENAGEKGLVFLLYAVERTLIYFAKWGENRLSDQKGFEFQVAKTYRVNQ